MFGVPGLVFSITGGGSTQSWRRSFPAAVPVSGWTAARRPELFGQPRHATPGDLTADAVAAAPEMSLRELAALNAGPAVLCIDARGSMAYRIGHVPGSVNIRDDYLEYMLRHGIPFLPHARSCSSARPGSTPSGSPPS